MKHFKLQKTCLGENNESLEVVDLEETVWKRHFGGDRPYLGFHGKDHRETERTFFLYLA